MNWVDYFILAVVAVSTLVGLFRGFTREALNLAAWILAFWAAFAFAGPLADWLERYLSVPSVRAVLAYGGIFLAVLITGALITHAFSRMVRATPFSGPDRALGAGFGTARGVVIIVGLVMLAGLTAVRHDPWWTESTFITRIEPMADWVRAQMPQDWIDIIRTGQQEARAAVMN